MTDIKGFKGDMYQTSIVAKYELLKYIRSKKLYIFLALIAVFFVLVTALSAYSEDGIPNDIDAFLKLYLSLVSMIVIFAATLFAATALVSEFEERTALLVFTRPVKKSSIFLGKLVASFIFSALMVLVYYVIVIIASLIVCKEFDARIFESFGVALVFVFSASGIAFFLSSISKKGSTAAIMSFVIMFIIFYFIIDSMLMTFGIEPIFSPTYNATALYTTVFGEVTSVIDGGDFGAPGFEVTSYVPESVLLSVGIMLVWAVATLIPAHLIFKRREF